MLRDKKLIKGLIITSTMISGLMTAGVVYAAPDPTTVSSKLNAGLVAIQTILLGVIVVVGIIASAKILIAKLPSADDPHVKNEMWRGLGMVGGAVALGGALIWLIPWVYTLFA